ncbi:hypothetical protein ACHAXT_002628 [Thalassiosira profunda]
MILCQRGDKRRRPTKSLEDELRVGQVLATSFTMNCNWAYFLVFAAAWISEAAATLPLNHLSQPSLLWNQAIQSPPRNDNVVFLSPDDRWVYVTSSDGTLSKLDPENGDYLDVYAPEKRWADGRQYGEGGIAFHEGFGDEESYFVYFIVEVPPLGLGATPSSRVIALRHDDSRELTELWSRVLEGSTVSGTPAIGTEGKFVYLTMDSIPAPPPTETEAPAAAPVAPAATSLTTGSPTMVGTSTGAAGDADDANEPTQSPGTTIFDRELEPARQREHAATADEVLGLGPDRRLQSPERSGRFVILSHPLDGEIIYQFDSRDELSIQKHSFAPVGIARRPQEGGNYNGGKDNTNDLLMWAAKNDGSVPQQGETMLFQLPIGFDQFDSSIVATLDFEVRVLESVAWTTQTRPTFSKDGQDVYFAVTGNRFTGWNQGRRFDVVSNLGEIPLPPQSADEMNDSAGRPIALADDDSLLLIGSTDYDRFYGVEATSGGIVWTISDLGTNTIFTATVLSPDRDIAYFGKKNAVHAINVTDGSRLWGEEGYVHPSSTPGDIRMVADFSLSSTGELLSYAWSDAAIATIQIAEVIPTEEPTASPSSAPSRITESPSAMPSAEVTASPSADESASPSESAMPSTTIAPTVTSSPSYDPDYIPPSSAPTSTSVPSVLPSVALTNSSSETLYPSTAPSQPTTLPPVADAGTGGTGPTQSPVASPPSSAVESPTDGEDSAPLSQSSIIGIVVGGGIGLLLLVGCTIYLCMKRRGEDDGVDTEWQRSNNASATNAAGGGEEEGQQFQYDDGQVEAGENHQRWGEQGQQLRW